MTYGGDEGLFELAMLRDDKCCYDTPIADDACGWLEVEDVLDILEDVQRIYGGILMKYIFSGSCTLTQLSRQIALMKHMKSL